MHGFASHCEWLRQLSSTPFPPCFGLSDFYDNSRHCSSAISFAFADRNLHLRLPVNELEKIDAMKPFIFETRGNNFWRDGKVHRIFSGALHYFRVPAPYWEDRLRKYAACGLNTVETYIPWNLHEPKPGEFQFSGMLDLRRFVTLAGSLGLDVILRPGPYICAEWESGGLPSWLLKDRGMRLRSSYPPFLTAVENYLRRVVTEVADLQCHRGGPIIALQIENEYGSYGNDKSYLASLESFLKRAGTEVLLFTSDDPSDCTLQGGTLPHVLKTVNFGSKATSAFENLRKHQPEGPLMCMEFWLGWFDHWTGHHHTRDAEDAAASLDEILSLGASVNIYMMHGGTNFGFLNGANDAGTYMPTVTSYDYDAPLDEQGEPTAKFYAIREVLRKHGAKPGELPPPAQSASYGSIPILGSRRLFDVLPNLSQPIESPYPLAMEEIGQSFGYILYRTTVPDSRFPRPLTLVDVRDRALIYQDGEFLGTAHRNDQASNPPLEIRGESSRLDILVENEGRVNHGPKLHDRKGITSGVRLGPQFHAGWQIYPLDLTEFPALDWEPILPPRGPTFYQAIFTAKIPCDTFLRVTGSNGAAWINGFCLGRYRSAGPQQTLYIPAPLQKAGENQLIIFDLEPTETPKISLESKSDLGPASLG